MNGADKINKANISVTKTISYEEAQPNGPVVLREYILTAIGKDKGCLFKFEKTEAIDISYMTFDVFEFDSKEEQIASHRHTVKSFEIAQKWGDFTFEPKLAIYVDKKCHSIKIQMFEIVSGAYVYTFEGNETFTEYKIAEKYTDSSKKRKSKKLTAQKYEAMTQGNLKLGKKEKIKVKSKRGKKPFIIWLAALFVLLFLVEVILKSHLIEVVPIDEIKEGIAYFAKYLFESSIDFAVQTVTGIFKLIGQTAQAFLGLLMRLLSFSK